MDPHSRAPKKNTSHGNEVLRNTQNYTLDVNKQLDHSSADNCTAQHSDIQHAARDQRRAPGHEVLVVVVFQAVHKVTLHMATVISADRPVEGLSLIHI